MWGRLLSSSHFSPLRTTNKNAIAAKATFLTILISAALHLFWAMKGTEYQINNIHLNWTISRITKTNKREILHNWLLQSSNKVSLIPHSILHRHCNGMNICGKLLLNLTKSVDKWDRLSESVGVINKSSSNTCVSRYDLDKRRADQKMTRFHTCSFLYSDLKKNKSYGMNQMNQSLWLVCGFIASNES